METDLSVLLVVTAMLSGPGCDPRPGAASDAGLDAAPTDSGGRPGCIAWGGVQMLGGPREDEASSVDVGLDGEVLVAGYADADNSFARVVPSGESRGVLWRIAPTGARDTLTVLDAPGPDALDLLARDRAGTLHAAGRTRGPLGGAPADPTRFDVVGGPLVDGAWIAPFRTGVRADDRPTALALDADGALHVAGYAEVEIDGNYVARWEDGFVARRTAGALVRVDSDLEAPDVVLAADARDGAVVIGGAVLSGDARGPFVARLDGALREVWSTRLSRISVDAITWLEITESGDVIAVGARSTGTAHDVAVYRLDGASGAATELATHGGAGAEWPTSAVRLPSGELVIVGETSEGIERPSRGVYDVFAMWLAPDGALTRVEELGSEGDDRPAAVGVDPCGTVVIAGYVSGPVGDAAALGRRDAFAAALGAGEEGVR